MTRSIGAALLAPLLLALAGCATPSWLCVAPTGASRLTIVTDPEANQNRALAVDLVFITNPDAAAVIAGLSARDWFTRRSQLRRDWREAITVTSWEVTPGQSVIDAPAAPPCNLSRSLVFADYAGPGEHRAQLGAASRARILLGPSDLSVDP